MRPPAAEHRCLGPAPAVVELCPRCRKGPLYRPQPGVVQCYAQGCPDSPDDRGDLYVSVAALTNLANDMGGLLVGINGSVAVWMDLRVRLEAMIRTALPHYPHEEAG